MLGSASALAQDAALLQRVQRLEDMQAIQGLLERFFEYQESGNRVAYANLFAKNGELILRMGHSKGGPEGILNPTRSTNGNAQPRAPRPQAAQSQTGQTQAARPRAANPDAEPSRHVLSNVHIELNGDTATARSRWTMLVPEEQPNRFRLGGSGTYCDKLVRENGEWKFLQRIIYCKVPEGMTPVN